MYRREIGILPLVVISGTYAAPIERGVLYSALSRLMAREPMLAANVFNVETDPVVRLLEEIDLDRVVVFEPTTLRDDVINRLVKDTDRMYEQPKTPLWRLHVVEDGRELVWAFDHSLFDGNCGPAFHLGLATEMDPAKSTDNPIVTLASSVTLPPALESLVDLRPPTWFLAKALFREFIASKLWTPKPAPRGLPGVSVPLVNETALGELSADELSAVLAKARGSGLTLVGVLHAAVISAALQQLPEYDPAREELSFECPVDARRYTKAGSSGLAPFIGNYVVSYDYDASPAIAANPSVRTELGISESFAQQFSTGLKSAVAAGRDICYGVGSLSYINVRDFISGFPKLTQRRKTAEVSNLGSLSPPSEAKIPLTRLTFAQAANSAGAPFVLNAVGLKQGPLVVSLSVATTERQQAQHLLDTVIGSIKTWAKIQS